MLRRNFIPAAAIALLSTSALAQDATYIYTPATPNQPPTMVMQPVPGPAPVAVIDNRVNDIPAGAYAGVEPRAATPSDMNYLGRPQEQLSSADSSVKFVTGGIGHVSQQQIKTLEHSYPLKLSFADNTGHYLANVNVTITDSANNTVLSAVTDGPFLLADLEPGNYTVTANYEGQTQTRKVSVANRGLRTANFSFRDMETHPEL